MWPDDDSDDEYDETGRYKHRYQELEVELVYFEQHIREAKNIAYDGLTYSKRETQRPDFQVFLQDVAGLDDRGKLRAYVERPAPGYIFDWRWDRALSVIRAFAKFHEGSLDLSGRFQERYIQIGQRIMLLVTEFYALSPYTVIKNFDDWEFDSSYQPTMQRPIVVQLSDIADEHIDIWHQFKARWKLSQVEYTTFAHEMSNFASVIKAHPQPIFQTRHLLDLPPELLLSIMEFVPAGLAIVLSATCHQLRAIALATAFSSRRFGMSVPDQMRLGLRQVSTSVGEQPSEILALMTRSRDAAVKRIDFFLSRQDMQGATRQLSFYNEWPWEAFGQYGFVDTSAGDYSFAPTDSDFYRPLRVAIRAVLRGDIPLVYLSFSYLMVDGGLAMNIARHPTLQDLIFRSCSTSVGLRTLVVSGVFQQLPPSSSRTLRVYVLDDEDIDMAWCALAICRNPQVLSITHSTHYDDIVAPHPDIEQLLLGAFARVQRLHLTHVPSSLAGLAEWLAAVHTAGHQLRLTHLKLDSNFPMDEAALLAVLAVISQANAPLTIIARGPRQTRPRSCEWPHRIYEYAAKLAGFRRLRVFCANFTVDFLQYTPIGLPQFQVDEFGSESLENWWNDKDRGYLNDTETAVVRPFAVLCPTLETFTLLGGMPYACGITRIDGRLVMRPAKPQLGLSTEFLAKWNPNERFSGSTWAPPNSRPSTMN